MAFLKNIYASSFVDQLQINSVTDKICVGKYVYDQASGTSVIIDALSVPTVRDYVVGTDMTVDAVSNTRVTLNLDQSKYTNQLIQDIDSFNSDIGYQESVSKNSGIAVGKVIDTYVLKAIRDAATKIINLEGVTLDSTNVLSKLFIPLVTAFNEAEVPEGMRKVVVTPEIDALIKLANIANRVEGINPNFVGTVMGIDVYWSNYLPANVITSSKKDLVALFPDSFAFAAGLSKVETVRSSTQFGEIFRELSIFGGKAVDASKLIKISFDEA